MKVMVYSKRALINFLIVALLSLAGWLIFITTLVSIDAAAEREVSAWNSFAVLQCIKQQPCVCSDQSANLANLLISWPICQSGQFANWLGNPICRWDDQSENHF